MDPLTRAVSNASESIYDKVVLAVVGCSAVGALLHCMYSIVVLRQKPCATDLKKPWEIQGI